MRQVGRRSILIGGALVAGMVGAGALIVPQSKRAAILAVIRSQFGDKIASAPAAIKFADAFETKHLTDDTARSTVKHVAIGYLPSNALEAISLDNDFATWVIRDFIRSTTAVRAYEADASLVFVGLGSEYEIKCANTLSDAWL